MKHIHLLYTLLFGVAVFLFFGLAYPHHQHYQEQYQLFLFDSNYVWEMVKLPGGIADLLGRFCTQFFLFAWVGALIIALLLSAVQLLTLRMANWGRLYGLSFVPSFLLWLFLLGENALLGGVWAVLLTLLASWGFDKIAERRGWKLISILLIVAIPVLYWIAGPVSLLFFLLHIPLLHPLLLGICNPRHPNIGISNPESTPESHPKTSKGISNPLSTPWYYSVFVLWAAMLFLLSFYLPVPARSLWMGIHYHRYPTEFPVLLWAAVLSVFVLTLLVRALHRWANASSGFLVPLLSFVLVAAGMGGLIWSNANFKAEKVMKYDFMARYQQWNRILDTISAERPNNQIGVTVQNLALGMHGLLTKHLFDYNQNGIVGLLPDIGTDAISPLPTAEAFYQLGMITVAQRTVFEAQEAILDFQKSGRCYQRLAQTNLILGHYEVARKYLTALQKTLFYREWANETLPLLGDEKAIAKHPEYGRLRQLAYKENFFFGDHVTAEMLLSLYRSNTDNHLALEYLKAYYILTGDRENYTNLLLHNQ